MHSLCKLLCGTCAVTLFVTIQSHSQQKQKKIKVEEREENKVKLIIIIIIIIIIIVKKGRVGRSKQGKNIKNETKENKS